MRYRPDVDGLRAVAIVPVVLYHAGIAPFGGGFVGVDVFFVISGYLITSLILSEMDAGVFTVAGFYVRRIRRIFPALFVMMAFCALAGWLVLAPQDYKLLGQSIFATAFFASNVLFWRQSGYFDVPASEKPLLHTWSLAVEEQFYAVFPLYLLLLCRFLPLWRVQITLIVCALSFATNVLTVRAHPQAAFFLASHRVWELLLGALLAMGALPQVRAARWRNVVGVGGLALILIAIFGFSKTTTFPGMAALLPALGTAAIVWVGASGRSALTGLLSRPEFVFVGKISYSLYLWHFSLLAFAGYLSIEGLTLGQRWLVIALSVLLAIASWVLVEQPVRRGRWIFARPRMVFGTAALALCAFGAVGLATHRADGFPTRIGPAGQRILAAGADFNPDREQCPTDNVADVASGRFCKLGTADVVEPQFILWGDSHAESLRPAVGAAALQYKKSGIFAGLGGCAPVMDIDRADEPDCVPVNAAITKLILSTPSITTVILAARWGLWAEGTRYKRETRGGPVAISDVRGSRTPPVNNLGALTIGLDRTIAVLTAAGKRVWLVGPIPEVGYPVPRALYLAHFGKLQNVDIAPTYNEFETRQRHVFSLFGVLAKKYPVNIVWPHEVLCNPRFCQVERHGTPVYTDDNHLTFSAAKSLSPIFEPAFRDN